MHDPYDTTPQGHPHAPRTCPYDHPIGPGTVIVGWLPCGCRWAGELRGHRTYYCRACRELSDRRQTISYWPPHDRATA